MTCTNDLAPVPGRARSLVPRYHAAPAFPPVADGAPRWWSHEASLPLAPDGGCATVARRHTSTVLAGWGLVHILDDARLVVTELVANAETATRSAGVPARIGLRLLANRSLLAVEVWDGVSAPPQLRPPGLPVLDGSDLTEPRGNGLAVVNHLALRWGHTARPDGGKVVYAFLKR